MKEKFYVWLARISFVIILADLIGFLWFFSVEFLAEATIHTFIFCVLQGLTIGLTAAVTALVYCIALLPLWYLGFKRTK